jgi:hypothetical protein
MLLSLVIVALSSLQEQAPVPRASPSLLLVKTIALPKVSGRIDHLDVDRGTNVAIVAARNNGTVEFVGLGTGTVQEPLAGRAEPQGVAFMAHVGHAAVTFGGPGWLRIVDSVFSPSGVPGAMPEGGPVGDDADNVRYLPKSRDLLVGYGDGGLARVEVAQAKVEDQTKAAFDGRFRVLHRIELAGHPESLQVDAAEQRAWVNVPTTSSIAVVDLEQRKVVRTIALKTAKQNYPMALDEAEGRLLVGCRSPARLLVFDLANDALLAELPLGGDVDDVFVDRERGLVYASCGEGTLDVFQRTAPGAWTPKERIPTAPGARTCQFVADSSQLILAVPRRGDAPAEIRVYSTKP